jgi:hypothetical protein
MLCGLLGGFHSGWVACRRSEVVRCGRTRFAACIAAVSVVEEHDRESCAGCRCGMSISVVGERLAAGGVVGGVALPIPSTQCEDERHAAVTVNVLWGRVEDVIGCRD